MRQWRLRTGILAGVACGACWHSPAHDIADRALITKVGRKYKVQARPYELAHRCLEARKIRHLAEVMKRVHRSIREVRIYPSPVEGQRLHAVVPTLPSSSAALYRLLLCLARMTNLRISVKCLTNSYICTSTACDLKMVGYNFLSMASVTTGPQYDVRTVS